MKPPLFLANVFINTFGITQPSERTPQRAAWFIAVLLGIVLVIVATIGVVALHWVSVGP
jgi:hypothetical protein